MSNVITKYKKLIIAALIILMLPFIIPLIQIIGQIIFEGGKIVGTSIRFYSSMCIY